MAPIAGWSVFIWLFFLVTRCASSSITTTATSTSSNFIGYYFNPNGKTETLTAGNAWTTSETFAGDCDSGSATCALATKCDSNTLYMNDGEAGSCGDGLACVSFTIFQSSPNASPSATNYGCREGWSANTVYRELATATSTSTDSTSTSETTSMSATSTSTSTAPTTSSTSSTSSGSGSSSSKAWIAGAVVGPVAALAMIALGFYLLRRRRRTAAAPTPDSNEGMRHLDGHNSAKTELDASTTPSMQYDPVEMPSRQYAPVEMPSRQYVPVELDAGRNHWLQGSPAELS
ncbi:hypothetical protein BJ166DRAFT_117832 [Pestalotiopsis sp. NC0098]|nr:hypothetical protein BJ166DRAFT_117832 [Pestalotiopsis sp. NC0098]